MKKRKSSFVNGDLKQYMKKCGKVWRENRFLVKPFLVLLSIYLLGILAIILARVHYADDVARTAYGYAGWSGFSRYISTILSHGLHADNYLTNIAPLPQILAVAMLSLASLVMIIVVLGKDIFRQKWTKWIWIVVAVLPLGLCLYMLECLSYQYDAVYMGMSVLFAVFPLMFYRRFRFLYAIMIVVGVLGVCMTYQASIGIYLILATLVAMKEWNEKKKVGEVAKFVGLSVVVFALTVVVFQKFLMIPREVYASNAVPGVNEFPPMFLSHLLKYFELVISDFKILWLVLVAVIAISFVIVFAIRSKRNKIIAVICGVIGVILMAVMAYALYAALERPLYATRAMYAIGAWVAVMGVYVVGGECKIIWKRVSQIVPVAVLSWCFLIFGFTYGNMLAEQNIYRNKQIGMVMDDLNEIIVGLGSGLKVIQVEGQIGWAPVVAHAPEGDYRILKRLLRPSFGIDVPWMAYEITQNSGFSNLIYNLNIDLDEASLPKLKETVLYNIYGDEDGILVKFKGEEFGLEE